MPAKSVSPLVMLRNGNRQPEGDVRLSSSILTMLVSVTTACRRSSALVEVRLISP